MFTTISRIRDTFEDTNDAKSTDEKITGIESGSSRKFVEGCREFDLAKLQDGRLEYSSNYYTEILRKPLED